MNIPRTSSFKIGEDIHRNIVCFSLINNSIEDNRFIIIEKNKQLYSLPIIFNYLDDIRDMGIDYKGYSIDPDTEEIYIEYGNINKTHAIILGILVRYMWEGMLGNPRDSFYHFFDTYREVKYELPEINKLKLMCLAHNIAIFKNKFKKIGYSLYNSNHALCHSTGCKLRNNLPINGVSVNYYFSEQLSSEIKSLYKDVKMNRKNLLELLNKL